MATYWCEQAWLPHGPTGSVRLQVSGGRLTRVAVEPPAPGDLRISGLVLPGLANAHSHAFHRALRGRTHAGGGDFWTWREHMYAVAARLDPERYLALARGVFAELALAGYTVVGEFHYLHHGPGGRPYADPNAMGLALVQAADEAGIRLTLLDTLYLTGGLDPHRHLTVDATQQRFSDGTAKRWADRVSDLAVTLAAPSAATVRLGVAAHSLRAVPREALAGVRRTQEAIRRADHALPPLHIHVCEQPAENDAVLARYGCTPVELLSAEGLLRTGTTLVHATHLSPADVAAVGRSGAAVCLCPTTEADLGDGIGPGRALADAGTPLCVGSDQHAIADPFAELRGVELHERLHTGRRGHFSPSELVSLGSATGYAALGWPDGGRLAVGALADFVAVALDSPRTIGCRPGQLPWAATAADVRTVVVAGEQVVTDGRHRLGDVGRLLGDALAALDSAAVEVDTLPGCGRKGSA